MNNAIKNIGLSHYAYPYVKCLNYSAACQKYDGIVYTLSPIQLTRREMNTILSNTIGWSYLKFKLYKIYEQRNQNR